MSCIHISVRDSRFPATTQNFAYFLKPKKDVASSCADASIVACIFNRLFCSKIKSKILSASALNDRRTSSYKNKPNIAGMFFRTVKKKFGVVTKCSLKTREHEGTERDTEGVGCDMS